MCSLMSWRAGAILGEVFILERQAADERDADMQLNSKTRGNSET